MSQPPTDAGKPGSADRNTLEILATVLLSLAAVGTAWAGFQANRWNGEQAKAAGRANASRVSAARAQGLSQAQTQVDIATYIQWVDAQVTGQPVLADFFRQRFRPEFKPAFDAWLATEPFTSPTAPPTPFAMPQYRLAASAEAERLDVQSEASSARVRYGIQISGNYVLGVVLLAVALFFAGMSTKLKRPGPRKTLLAVGCAIFVGTVVWIGSLPVTFSI